MTSESNEPVTLQQLDARHRLAEEEFRRAERAFDAAKKKFEAAHQAYIDGAEALGVIL